MFLARISSLKGNQMKTTKAASIVEGILIFYDPQYNHMPVIVFDTYLVQILKEFHWNESVQQPFHLAPLQIVASTSCFLPQIILSHNYFGDNQRYCEIAYNFCYASTLFGLFLIDQIKEAVYLLLGSLRHRSL